MSRHQCRDLRLRIVDSDYGVLHLDGVNGSVRNVVGYEEKPKIPYIVSMGVYVANPEVIELIPPASRSTFPTWCWRSGRRPSGRVLRLRRLLARYRAT